MKYHGYVYIGDILKKKKELKKMREYSNLIGMVTTQKSLRNKYDSTNINDRITFLKKEGQRIKYFQYKIKQSQILL